MSEDLHASSDVATDRSANQPDRPDLQDEGLTALLAFFYATLDRDPLLAPYFASLDMSAHLPRIVDFWSTIIFHTGRYSGNAFKPHLEMPGLTTEHFARWVATLEQVVDAQFAGDHASAMKALAHRIAYSMQVRLSITPFAPFHAGALPSDGFARLESAPDGKSKD